jgi:predicted RNA-binding protein YlxR (DUF448 family)
MCVACRQKAPRASLIRVVADPDGQVWVDRYLKAPGRGAHLCYSYECIALAVKKRSLQSSFKRPLLPLELNVFLRQLIDAQHLKVRDLLSLGRRRGQMISGLNLLQSQAHLLYVVIFAFKVSPQSREKLSSKINCPLLEFGERQFLGETQGKENRVAIGVTDETLAHTLIQEITRHQKLLVASENR